MENQPQQPQSEYFTIAGHRIHCWLGGTGPNLLLIHAAWGDAEMSWSTVWTDLAQTFTVIAPDLPGFGRSSPLPRSSVHGMVDLLKHLLDELNVDHAIVVGNSFGATVALEFANAFPKTCDRLILVNGGYTPNIPAVFRQFFTLPPFRQILGWMMRSMTFSRRALKHAFVHPKKIPHGFLEKVRKNAPAYSAIVRDSWLALSNPPARPSAPTLLLWGAADSMAPVRHALFIHKRMPGSTLSLVERAGHMPQLEQGEEFTEALRHFTATSEVPIP